MKAMVPFLALNRGIIARKALARVDIDRTRVSAERMTNWLPSTVGSMSIRPGTKWLGSSLNDTGAEYLEFVASTDDVALVELTHQKMRLWLGSDAHSLSLLGRPKVDTTVSLSDTGWSNTSIGGAFSTASFDVLPTMTGPTTNGVTIVGFPEETTYSGSGGGERPGWKVADDVLNSGWQDTGDGFNHILNVGPSQLRIDFGSDTGNRKAINAYSMRAVWAADALQHTPRIWRLLSSNWDTGTYNTDTGKWALEDTQGSESAWAVSERRNYTTNIGDTGTVDPKRHWRFYFYESDGGSAEIILAELEMFVAATAQQVQLVGGRRLLNATSIGATARTEKRVIVSDTGTEHSLAIYIERGPVTMRVGSTQRADDYVAETSLGTGYHNLAFTPTTNFWITLQSDTLVDRIVGSMAIGDSGTVEITAPWQANDLGNVRYDQSADVVYVDCMDVVQSKIERRGTGRSWSIVDYRPNDGPFQPTASSEAKLSVSYFFGNTKLDSDIPFFTTDHVGALFRIFHEGQSGQWRLGALDATTEAVNVTGYGDTGAGAGGERRLTVSVSGTWAGTIKLERSFDGEDQGFHDVDTNFMANATASDTGTFSRTIDDTDDNVTVWYRARVSVYTSGVALVTFTRAGGGVTGFCRVTGFSSNQSVDIEVLSRFSDTGPSNNWQEGHWSAAAGFPSSVSLYGGRLCHAEGGTLFLSVSDDYENFDDGTVGDAAPIVRSLGSGPVDAVRFLIAKLRLIIGTSGAELALATSSLDEPPTPTNCSARLFSTQGSANLRALHLDTRAIHVQRSGSRLYMIGPSEAAFGDYASFDLTRMVPDLLRDEGGVVSLAVQRQPDSRIHVVCASGKVAILTYEPEEEVVCWSLWEGDTGTAAAVEKVAVLPGNTEDAVFYHVRRTINGATKRYLEKWSKESECTGDTGLTWLIDCARSFTTDTGRTDVLTDIATHLVGESLVVWSDDTGSIPGVDRSPDVNGVQIRHTPDTGGDITLSTSVHHAVAGLPFSATWLSAKLAYFAPGGAGTGLAQLKRIGSLGVVVDNCHNDGIRFGADSGHLDPLPRILNEGAEVDADHIHRSEEFVSLSFPGLWKADARLMLQAKSPRPATVLALVPGVDTKEKF